MWPGQDNASVPPVTHQPGVQFMQNQPYPPGVGQPPFQQMPMTPYPPQQPSLGYPQQFQPAVYLQQQGPYPMMMGPPPSPGVPIMGQPTSNGGGGGMLSKVMGMVNEVVDVNPMNSMHSTGNFITGYRAPPMMPLGTVAGCPFGLELLLETESVMVQQQIEKMEALLEQVGVPVETPNRYDICNSAGNRIYFAAEVGGLLGMQFAPTGSSRPFKITVVDFAGRTVLNINRPYSCLFCCLSTCNCCGSSGTQVAVTLGDGTPLGKISQKFNWCRPFLAVQDESGNKVAEIKGPRCADCCCSCCCTGECGCDANFNIHTIDGTKVGKVTKKFSGFIQEGFTDADNFEVNYPQNMDVRSKALLLAAVF